MVNIQLNIVACPTYPDEFTRHVVAPFVRLWVVIVTLPVQCSVISQLAVWRWQYYNRHCYKNTAM